MNKVKLKDIASITMGQSPNGDDVYSSKIGLPLLNGPAEFTSSFPIPVQYTTDAKRIAEPNDILFCVRGSTTGRMNIADQKYAIGRGLAAIQHIRDSRLNVYVKALIEVNLKKLLGGTLGSVFPNLTKDNLFDLECQIHNEQAQKNIAKLLSALDAKIELNNRINAELEAMAKTLYDYWFVQFEFPVPEPVPGALSPSGEMPEGQRGYKFSGGKMVWSEELKREIPDGWKVGMATDLFNFNPSLSLKKGAMNSYIDMNALPTEGFMTKEIQAKEFNGGVKFQNGDVIIARITPCLENGKTGLITLLKEDEVGFGSTEFIVLRGKDLKLSSFAALLARSELFRKFAIANMLGTSGRKRIEASRLGKFSMVIPPIDLLEKFEKIVNPFFEKETLTTRENQHLSSLRDWLLPMLMNGQVTVGVKETAVYKEGEEMRVAAEPGGEN